MGIRGGEVVDEDAGALAEGEKGVLVEGNIAGVGAAAQLLLHHSPHNRFRQLLRFRHHLRRQRRLHPLPLL